MDNTVLDNDTMDPSVLLHILHDLAKAYSSCVGYPMQRLFLTLSTEQNFLIFDDNLIMLKFLYPLTVS